MIARTAYQQGLPRFLNYRRFVAPAVIELADGALQRSFALSGPDQEYTAHRTMAHDADQLGRDLAHLGNGWMVEANAVRVPKVVAAKSHHCPEPTSALVHEERAARYAKAGIYYQAEHLLTVTYLPPGAVQQQVSEYFFADAQMGRKASRKELVSAFISETDRLAEALGRTLTLDQMTDDATVHFLRFCVTGEHRPIGIPEGKGDLHYAIGTVPLAPHGGEVGDLYTRVVGIIGWPGDGTVAQMFEPVLRLPFLLRMQQRFIFLSREEAVKRLRLKQSHWQQLNIWNPKYVIQKMLGPLTGTNADDRNVVQKNTDAENQADSVEREIELVQSGAVAGGYYTHSVVLHDEDEAHVVAHAKEVAAVINGLGFKALIETDNAADARGGSWPGHGTRNVRDYLFNTAHFARLWSTSSQWQGEEEAPCPYYAKGSGPLIITTSTGHTPYYVNLHNEDLGNTGIIGGSGAGKSYAVGNLILAHLQYAHAQVNVLDRDKSQLVPVLACGGSYFDIEAMHYAPLAHVDEEIERAWALRLLEVMAKYRDFQMTPQARKDLEIALVSVGTGDVKYRTITHFLAQLQTHEKGLEEALSFYTLTKGGGILDGDPGTEQDAAVQAWDMEKILKHGAEISTPVLMHLLHQMDRRMDGRPTLTIIEEVQQTHGEPTLQEEIIAASANYRKKNAALVLVLHSPDLKSYFVRSNVLLANLATKIFLPNEHADTDELRPHYMTMGLGQREISMLARDLQQKRHYYTVKGDDQRRVWEFDNGPVAHALLGVNGRDEARRVFALQAEHGELWLPAWLRERGHEDLAMRWEEKQRQQERDAT